MAHFIQDLKRFQQVSRTPISFFASLKKIDDFISFPEYLDLKPFIAPRREEFGLRPAKIKNNKGAYNEQVMYRLYAVVVHIGNMVGVYGVCIDGLLTFISSEAITSHIQLFKPRKPDHPTARVHQKLEYPSVDGLSKVTRSFE
jgi:hypothetical protein